MLCFIAVRGDYDFKGANYLAFTDEHAMDRKPEDYTPEDCPFALIVSDRPEGQKEQSVLLLAPIPYGYKNNWQTEDGQGHDGAALSGARVRGSAYRELKEQAGKILLDRACDKLGEDFRQSVLFSIPFHPAFVRALYEQRAGGLSWAGVMRRRITGSFFRRPRWSRTSTWSGSGLFRDSVWPE